MDSDNPRLLRVFLCHASGDKPAVRTLYRKLRSDNVLPWLDEENLLPGQDWAQEISRAVRNSDAVIVCLSRASINKSGYVQKEIRYALDVADEQPESAIFIVPLKLEECDVPERLRRWHWVNLFAEKGYQKLTEALRARAAALNLHPEQGLARRDEARPRPDDVRRRGPLGKSAPLDPVKGVEYGILGTCLHGTSRVAFAPHGFMLASGGGGYAERGAVCTWDIRTKQMQLLGRCDGKVSGVAFSPNGKTVASASYDNTVRLWDIATSEMRILGTVGHQATSVDFSPDGRHLVVASREFKFRVWDVQTDQVRIFEDKFSNNRVHSAMFSPDGKSIASGGYDKKVSIWDVRTGKVQELGQGGGSIWSVAFSPDGNSVASAGDEKPIRIWDVKTRRMRVLGECDESVDSVVFSPDGKWVASGSRDNVVRLWNVASGRVYILGRCDAYVTSVAFSSGGKILASGSYDNTVRLWDTEAIWPTPSVAGNTAFKLVGYRKASVVQLVGSFNRWQQEQLTFADINGEWVCRINLAPGRYTYKFIVDGEWMTDPDNSQKETDRDGNVNSVLIVRP
ncbi:MAG: TIR domain-containing protein [Acidobacteria bacterium]|nr:TIR domain-containing protein [Acidobacteriota bacterium]